MNLAAKMEFFWILCVNFLSHSKHTKVHVYNPKMGIGFNFLSNKSHACKYIDPNFDASIPNKKRLLKRGRGMKLILLTPPQRPPHMRYRPSLSLCCCLPQIFFNTLIHQWTLSPPYWKIKWQKEIRAASYNHEFCFDCVNRLEKMPTYVVSCVYK